jgi:FkbH-like protein
MADKTSMENISDLPAILSQWHDNPAFRVSMGRVFDTKDFNVAQKLLRAWDNSKLAETVNWPDSQRIHIGLCGFGTLNYLAPYVSWAALADGAVAKITLGSYNQLFQDLSNPTSLVTAKDVELLWVWVDLTDLIPAEVMAKPDRLMSPEGVEAVTDTVDSLVSALSAARERFNGFLLVNDFVPMRRSPFGIADSNHSVPFEHLYRHANDRLHSQLNKITHAGVFPLSHHIRHFGLSRAIDPRLRLMADCLFTQEFFFELARGIRPYFRALKAAIRKVLVLDLDNTLWGGIVGEDGWDGVKIGTDPMGKAFALFQSAILELYNRGVILAINSKNNLDDVKEIFERRDEVILNLEHFASVQVNWQDKVTNCKAIAEEINVGMDSLVFWDDNPAERLFVRETTKDVYVVEPPSDPSEWADFLRNMDLFDSLQISEEDSRRGQMYAEERRRRDIASAAPDIESFLASLNLKVKCKLACEENIPRIVSLLTRTNQFNLTTKRHSEQNVRKWSKDPNWKIMSYAAEDRFGSYGIVGVTILKLLPDYAEIDSLLLSCRAIGKGIEDVMLAVVAQQTCQTGLTKLQATYIPTRKNAPIKDFLPNNRFSQKSSCEEAVEYCIDLEEHNLSIPEHVTVENTT